MTEFMEKKQLREAEPRVVQAWPSPQDYNESIQNPDSCFSDPSLRYAQPELNFLGIPKTASGNFASVYHLSTARSDWAVRCFLHPYGDQEQRYKAISDKFAELHAPYLADFNYLKNGIKVAGKQYPILKMEWIQGQTLVQYIEEHLRNPQKLSRLASSFAESVCDMQMHGIAHGDLQHGNIIVESSGQIRFVDYDNCFVPELAGVSSHELGHSNYQHPRRSFVDFNAEMDNFSAWLIWISILALAEDPSLWLTLDAGCDCLLFKQNDLQNPLGSKAFHTLETHQSQRIRQSARFLRSLLQKEPADIPHLSEKVVEAVDLPELEELIENDAVEPASADLSSNQGESSEQPSPFFIAQPVSIKKPRSPVPPAMRALLWSRKPANLVLALLISAASFLILFAFSAWYALDACHHNRVEKQTVPLAANKPANQWADFDKNIQQLMTAGMTAYKSGNFTVAESKFNVALKETEKLAYDDVRLIEPLSSLAELYRLQGKYEQSEKMLKRVVEVSQAYPETNRISLIKALNNIASVYKTEAKFSMAEAAYAQAADLAKRVDAKTLNSENSASLSNLRAQNANGSADLQRIYNHFNLAETLCKKGLDIRRKSAKRENAEIAESLSTLGRIYGSQGKYKEAIPAYKEAVCDLEKEYGKSSPYLANTINGLASVYLASGKFADAAKAFNRELKILDSSFGKDHPLSAEAFNGLAATKSASGKFAEAESLLRHAMAIREKTFGKTHIFYADSLNKIAELYRNEEKYAKSIDYYKQAMAIYVRDSKANSAGIAALLNNMGLLALDQGEYREAQHLFDDARVINEKNLGVEHPIVITNLNNIAISLQEQGRYSDAEKLYKKALAAREKTLGPNHQAVAQSLENLASLYQLQGRDEEAAALGKRALAIKDGGKQFSLTNKVI